MKEKKVFLWLNILKKEEIRKYKQIYLKLRMTVERNQYSKFNSKYHLLSLQILSLYQNIFIITY